jgi:hypothetical protein
MMMMMMIVIMMMMMMMMITVITILNKNMCNRKVTFNFFCGSSFYEN